MVRGREVGLSVALMVGTVLGGLAVRFAPLGLPAFVVKYGGSCLWALMIYWVVSTVLPGWRLWAAGLLAAGIATGVELLKLYRSPGLDAFRHTLAGILLLGRIFSGWDIVTYLVAIGVGVGMDWGMRGRSGWRGGSYSSSWDR